MTKTIILKSERLIINRPGRTASAICEKCAGGMLTLEEAVAVAGVSSRVIHRRVEMGAVHFDETPDGLLLVCLNALAAHVGLTEPPAEQQLSLKGEADPDTGES